MIVGFCRDTATVCGLSVNETGAPNENTVQKHLNIALLNVF